MGSYYDVLQQSFVRKIDHFIEKNLDNPSFSVDEVCLELGISRSQLHRLLIEHTQLSATLYIRKIRLKKAKNLLESTNQRISEISDAVGINSHANFSKYFFEEFQLSPTDFRKQIQQKQLTMAMTQYWFRHLPKLLKIRLKLYLPTSSFAQSLCSLVLLVFGLRSA
ncbi:MAG: AraC family transcriptional regulator [Spirosomataceae bacterium]